MKDIIISGLLNKPIVYIVGSGPNGIEAYNKIPESARVIACNMAITAPIPTKFWICEDGSIPSKKWFHEAYKKYDVIKIFSNAIRKITHADYGFIHKRIWQENNPKYIKGITYGGATVACRALQIAAMSGASKIILVGVDMSGSLYFDGTEGDCQAEIRRRGLWMQAKAFDQIIRWIERNTNARVFSLTKTALQAPELIDSRDL